MADEQHKPDRANARKGGPLSPEQRARSQARFLAAYRQTANITYSCKKAGIGRATYYEWRERDEAFKAQLPDAEMEANDMLEAAAYDRAVLGVPSHVVSQGRIVYEDVPVKNADGTPKLDKYGEQMYTRGKPLIERKYSDALLTVLLKARMPDKYKDRVSNEHSGPGGGPIQSEGLVIDTRELTDEELALLKAIALAKKASEA